MPYIQVNMLEGRTQEQRERLAKAITDATAEILEINKENVWIEFSDIPKTHFANGGILRSSKK